jgi:hypothetical protein
VHIVLTVTLHSLNGTTKARFLCMGVYLFMFHVVYYILCCIINTDISKAFIFMASYATKADASTDVRWCHMLLKMLSHPPL